MATKKSKKYYVVWVGENPGIYESWAECQQQIKNYPQARYKSFKKLEEAKDAYHADLNDFWGKGKDTPALEKPTPLPDSIAVDAACSGNPGLMEYRGVVTDSGEEIFRMGPYKSGTNNVGEFLALVHALALLKKMKNDRTPVYTDSKIAMGWVEKKKAKTKLKKTRENTVLFDLIERAEKWLKNNQWNNPIIKWPTKKWGEIPADFGRK
nr:ribonuclease H family protein [Saprospiraceae bacterium]